MRSWLIALALPAAMLADSDGGFDRTLRVSGPVVLDITNDSGRISVQAGSASEVTIRATMRAHRHNGLSRTDAIERIRRIEANPPVEQSGDTIRIGYFRERDATRGVSITYEITTPPNTRLNSRNDSGGHFVAGIDGPVDITSDSGGVRVSSIRGDVKVQADSGGIEVTDVEGSVIAHADSGGVRAMNVAGMLDLVTDSGGIRFSQTRPAPVKAHADSGGITGQLVPNAGYDVEFSTDSGRVDSELPVTVNGSLSRRRIQGKIAGGGPRVDLRTDSGNVTIR